jgi:hypothetical protein
MIKVGDLKPKFVLKMSHFGDVVDYVWCERLSAAQFIQIVP